MERDSATLYEIINMSDKYTIEVKSLDVAFVACLLLGDGQYAFQPIGEGVEVPLFLFGGAEEWCKKQFNEEIGDTISRVTNAKAEELAECFDSVLIGAAEDRQAYRDGLELIDDPNKREMWRNRWHDERRSSLNDIGGRAYEMAKRLRTKQSNFVEPAPTQVLRRH